jgi:hypothetical protein
VCRSLVLLAGAPRRDSIGRSRPPRRAPRLGRSCPRRRSGGAWCVPPPGGTAGGRSRPACASPVRAAAARATVVPVRAAGVPHERRSRRCG